MTLNILLEYKNYTEYSVNINHFFFTSDNGDFDLKLSENRL